MRTIILRSAKVLNVEIDPDGAYEMAKRSRGTPRLANRLLKRVRDFAQVRYDGVITRQVAQEALDLSGCRQTRAWIHRTVRSCRH